MRLDFLVRLLVLLVFLSPPVQAEPPHSRRYAETAAFGYCPGKEPPPPQLLPPVQSGTYEIRDWRRYGNCETSTDVDLFTDEETLTVLCHSSTEYGF